MFWKSSATLNTSQQYTLKQKICLILYFPLWHFSDNTYTQESKKPCTVKQALEETKMKSYFTLLQWFFSRLVGSLAITFFIFVVCGIFTVFVIGFFHFPVTTQEIQSVVPYLIGFAVLLYILVTLTLLRLR